MNQKEPKIALSFDERLTAITRSIGRYHLVLERYLLGLCRNHADAENLLSSLWVYFLHNVPDKDLENFTLMRMKARSLFIDHYRKIKRSKEDSVEVLPESGQRHFGKEAEGAEAENRFYERFWSEYPVDLPDIQKKIIYLYARYGFTIEELSARFEIPKSTVGDYLQRARAGLRRYLNDPNRF